MKKLFATGLVLTSAVLIYARNNSVPQPVGKPLPVASAPKPEIPLPPPEKHEKSLKFKVPEKRVSPPKKQEIAAKAAPLIRINAASLDAIKLEKIQERKDRLSSLASASHDSVRLDLGGDLPWPIPRSPLFQDNRDLGFHVGLNYRLDKRWNVTGVAGANMDMGTYPLKPNMEQIGIRANYRF